MTFRILHLWMNARNIASPRYLSTHKTPEAHANIWRLGANGYYVYSILQNYMVWR